MVTINPTTKKAIRQDFSIDFAYEVAFTRSVFSTGNPLLLDLLRADGSPRTRKLLFVIDSEVNRLHPQLAEQIANYCAAYPTELELRGTPLIVTGGESAKNDFQYVQDILEAIEAQKIDRHAYVLAIGGGAVLDLVGFAAAIAHRGVRHIRIPTTVLSQNDSGVGVKNGINYFNKKNFLGTFAPPYAVINDTTFLTTLDDRDWRAGISEAVKVALIRDAAFFDWIEANAAALNRRDLPTMETLIYRCAEHHMAHIATNGDPFEKGSSRPLDFGHWAAHKLEQLTDYEVRHGEAVAIGIALDVAYSHQLGLLDQAATQRILGGLQALGFAISHPALYNEAGTGLRPAVWDGLEEFREHLGGELTIMLLDRIGHGVEVHEMEAGLLDRALLCLPRIN
jgi:3-dehydroquinate synthase